MADLTLKLGGFTFSGAEIPQSIPFGGEQTLVTHKLVGGTRIIDAMGRDDAPIEWSGILYGKDAVTRARQLDGMRTAGAVLELSYRTFKYSVVVKSFHAEFERFYQIPYKIVLEVVRDYGEQPLPATPDLPMVLTADAQNLVALADAAQMPSELQQALKASAGAVTNVVSGNLASGLQAIKNVASGVQSAVQGAVSAATGVVATATNAVSTVTGAIQTAKDSIATAQNMVQTAITSATNSMTSLTTLGGILPGNPLSANIQKFGEKASAVASMAQLENIGSTLNRMSKNLDAYSLPPLKNLVTVTNPNLYKLAAENYGDASLWTVIAQANGLTDPFPRKEGNDQTFTLTIPPKPTNNASGGILV